LGNAPHGRKHLRNNYDYQQSEASLREERLLETAAKVRKHIGERFPDSGLMEVAGEVEQVMREALARAEAIRRPNWWLRGGMALLAVIALVSVLTYAPTREE
jgi:hypothetical protein